MKSSLFLLIVIGARAGLMPVLGQAPASGVITGRVFNPNTGEYIRNAQVRIEETGQGTTTESGGEFRLAPVPAGQATVTITYTGYRSATTTLNVGAGETVNREFNLVSTLEAARPQGETITLGQFVVSGEREGNAKAIMEQRNSMNVINSIASDSFGDNAEGNVGEFLRHVPGVELDQFYGEVRNVRLRGLDAEYTSVTIDGLAFASADAFAGGFTMELASLNSVEAIEVSKTVSADVDANAPAGTINLKTKRAFDRAGRRVSAQANVVLHSQEFTVKRTPGPNDDHESYKIRPGGIFEYSDIFFNRRLGVVLNVSESNVFQQALVSVFTFNRAPTPADPRPQVLTALNFQHRPRFNKRFSTTLTTDFRATPRLSLSLGLVYNYADLWMIPRNVTFNTGARNTVVGEDPLVRFTTNSSAASVTAESIGNSKMGETLTVLPKFEYKVGNFLLEGKFSHSDSVSWYDPLTRRGTVRDSSAVASSVNFVAERSSASDVDWKFTQISGPDIASGASFPIRAINLNDGRRSRVVQTTGEIVGTLKTSRLLPIIWKTGIKTHSELRTSRDGRAVKGATFVDSTASPAGTWANYDSAYDVDLGMVDGSITSLSGGRVFLLDLAKLGRAWRDRPADFRPSFTPANYYTAYIGSPRRYEEEVHAGFLMGTANVGRRSTVRAGLRWEGTDTDALEVNTRTPAEVRAAGFPVSAGRATTIPGLDYQFLSQPRVHRTGSYDNLFPSGSYKYQFTPNLNLHLGYSSTIRRPRIFGLWTINDETQRVSAPNPNLKPETSENLAARLAYYFEPVGQLSVSVFENRVQDLFISEELTAEEFGYEGGDLANYMFVTTNNSDSRVKIRGMEWEYSQSLSFLGEKFKRLNVRASYTRNYAEIRKPLLTPHAVSGGINYTLGRFNANVNANWVDDVPTNLSGQNYRRHRTNLDAGAGWRFTNHLSFNVSARNLLNTAYITMAKIGGNAPVITNHEITGITYTFALKGTY
ncbi:MAG: TonB-dependent receptor [Opitutaceae bacterium]|nr:TonB-dependent receptor [Opitutaceae bacterium]